MLIPLTFYWVAEPRELRWYKTTSGTASVFTGEIVDPGDLLDVEILEDYEDGTSFYYVTARKGCAGWLKACYVDAVAP